MKLVCGEVGWHGLILEACRLSPGSRTWANLCSREVSAIGGSIVDDDKEFFWQFGVIRGSFCAVTHSESRTVLS